MKVELIDLKKRYQQEKSEILKIIDSVLKKGHLIMTKEVYQFEKAICTCFKASSVMTLDLANQSGSSEGCIAM